MVLVAQEGTYGRWCLTRNRPLPRSVEYARSVRYLSEEWLIAANEAVRASSAPPGRLVIDQHVTDAGSWRTVIDTTSSIQRISADDDRASDDPSTAPNATFNQSRATAQALAQGETDAHQAFLLGAITFEGEIDVLIERRDTLRWLQETLAPVMALTTWD